MRPFLITTIALFLISTPVFAKPFSLDFVLEVESAKPMKGKVVVEEGQTTSVISEGLLVQFAPINDGPAVKIKADIWQKTDSVRQQHVADTTLITKLNNSAKISVSKDTNQKIKYSLMVTPSQ